MTARAVLFAVADSTPMSGEGEVETIRKLESARDSAVKACTQFSSQINALVATASARLSEKLDGLTTVALTTGCAGRRPGRVNDPATAAKYTPRSLTCQYRALTEKSEVGRVLL